MLKLIVNNALDLLEDAKLYLDQVSQAAYCQPVPKLSMATVGQHTRHFIEFFQCLTENLHPDSRKENPILNYDKRRRDHRIETNPQYAYMILEFLAKQLPELSSKDPIWFEFTDYQLDNCHLIPTSLERELIYNVEHTIHHFALIKIGLHLVEPDLELPRHFGIAPSTLRRSPVFVGQ